ncbi:MAG: alpha/beta hydrolase [Burkholderiales bacterium]|nr:alpha/beta hydrolase [Burkholderiales bacterium]
MNQDRQRHGMKVFGWIAGIALALAITTYIAFQVSPWPAVLLIRLVFDKGATDASQALEKHVPASIVEHRDLRYDAKDPDALVDVFYPKEIEGSDRPLPTIVWIHGGGWVSGTKGQIANYAKVLAHRGFTVASVDYTIAPRGTYPTPVRQANAALAFLTSNAKQLHVDPSSFVLAGDSAGSHIATQLANTIVSPAYASALGILPSLQRSQLRGMVLFCGAYDTKRINLEGPFGGFLRTVLWAYSGSKDFGTNPRFATASVIDHVTGDLPPAFVSAGNADPLLPQSKALVEKLRGLGVRVDSLFFPDDYTPPLSHEYQFDLDADAGRLALERAIRFLTNLVGE